MRRFDKTKNILKANLLAESRYLESKGLIKEGEDFGTGEDFSRESAAQEYAMKSGQNMYNDQPDLNKEINASEDIYSEGVKNFLAKLKEYNDKSGRDFFELEPKEGMIFSSGWGDNVTRIMGYYYKFMSYWSLSTDLEGNFDKASLDTPNERHYFYKKQFPEFLDFFKKNFKDRFDEYNISLDIKY